MKPTFRKKFILLFLFVIVACMLVLNIFCGISLRYAFVGDSNLLMAEYCQKIEDDLSSGSMNINTIIDYVSDSFSINTSVIDEDADVFFSHRLQIDERTKSDYESWLEFYLSKEEGKNNAPLFFSDSDDDEEGRLVFVKQISLGIYVVMTREMHGIEQDVSLVSKMILIVGLVICVMGTLVWSIATKNFANQITKMMVVTEKMAKLNFEEKIGDTSKGDFGMLSRSIDNMSDQLKNSIENLKDDVERRKCLLRDLSHEIKTPITTIRGYAENIQYFTEDDERLQKYCGIVLDECDEITALVEEMLTMSRLESEEYVKHFRDVELSELQGLIEIKIRNEYSDSNIEVSFEDGVLSCNPDLVLRAVLNFVGNAVKHAKIDTVITVEGLKTSKGYMFSVSNFGSEISKEDLKYIWDDFYKNDKARKRGNGHGIGLSIVKRIADIHCGSVDVKSENGVNTFMLILPL